MVVLSGAYCALLCWTQLPPRRLAPPPRRAGADVHMQSFGVDSIDLSPGTAAFLMGAYIKQTKYKTLEAQWSVDDSLD